MTFAERTYSLTKYCEVAGEEAQIWEAHIPLHQTSPPLHSI